MSAKNQMTTGVVASVEHAGGSRNGNPTYRVTFEDGRSWLTQTDGQVGYAATNFAPRRHLDQVHTVMIMVKGNRIVSMEEVASSLPMCENDDCCSPPTRHAPLTDDEILTAILGPKRASS